MPIVEIHSRIQAYHIPVLDAAIKAALLSIEELELKDASWIKVYFVTTYAMENPCMVKITLDKKLQRTKEILDRAADAIHDILKDHGDFTMIEVLTFCFTPALSGQRLSRKEDKPEEESNTNA